MSSGESPRSGTMRGIVRRHPTILVSILAVASGLLGPIQALGAPSPRKIGEMELRLLGVSASVEPAAPVVPKNIASAVRIVVRAGGTELSLADVARFVGAGFEVRGELSGPGLPGTLTLPIREPGDPLPADPLLLPLPALTKAGDYALQNLRLVSGGRTVLDVTPALVPIKVIDQILVTSVKTRPLTLDELRERGIDLAGADNYLGFAFTLGLKLESTVVDVTFPVVFDRDGFVVPEPLRPPPAPPRTPAGVPIASMPTVVPMLLEATSEVEGAPPPELKLPSGGGEVRIPGVLVIPGDVGYLKQFFSAQLFVANGAPTGSGLVVRDITGHIVLPLGADGIRGPDPVSGFDDDPLTLPNVIQDGESVPHPEELPVRGLGPDGEAGTPDDTDSFQPGEQGLADFTVRGEKEGFHTIDFDVHARLLGLPVGPVKLKGSARGGVLVRNPYFSMTFTAPSVVRADERFSLWVTVTNVGQGTANLLNVNIDDAALSGAEFGPGETGKRTIDTLPPGRSASFEFDFTSQRTGEVVASYLKFETSTPDGTKGDLRFRLGVGERGVPLSPDTISLPTAVDDLPTDVVRAAMRVLGQAWSVANAPAGTLPSDVTRTSRSLVTQKALALAEAGLRVRLGQPEDGAVRDLLYDFWSGDPEPDPGFDQLLRTTDAGFQLARAIGASLEAAAADAGGPLDYEHETSRLLASGRDFVAFAFSAATASRPDVVLNDETGRRTASTIGPGGISEAAIPGTVFTTLGTTEAAAVLGLVAAPAGSAYLLDLYPSETGPVDVSVTLPRGDGAVVRSSIEGIGLTAGEHARVVMNLVRPRSVKLERDLDVDGVVDEVVPLTVDPSVGFPEGPSLQSARVIGPETLTGASTFGVSLALLFDRIVDPDSAANASHYVIPDNQVRSARRQLSGRLVFGALDQPEGNLLPTTIDVEGVADTRGRVGPAALGEPLLSLVEDPGAVVTGHVLNGDGSPLAPGVRVTYLNDGAPVCGYGTYVGPVSQVAVDEAGGFEFRWVRRSLCGAAFKLLTQDPITGATREVSRHVRADGERIVLDIALFARGTVMGTVSKYVSGGSLTAPAPAITVSAVSVTDPQSSGTAVTDGDGRYRIDGITVGTVNVRAGGAAGLGSGVGRIDRPGTPAVVDILLDGNAAAVHGTVRQVDLNEPDPTLRTTTLPGQQVLYSLQGQLLAAATTDDEGRYRIADVPVGPFKVTAALNSRDRGSFEGEASVGEDVQADIFIEIPLDETLGTVRGTVLGRDPLTDLLVGVGDVYVTLGHQTVLSATSGAVGSYEIRGVPVTGTLSVTARTRDGKRSAARSFRFPDVPTPEATVDLTLSGLGEVRVTVLDPSGAEMKNQAVLLQGVCLNPCGCLSRSTGPGAGQPAVFDDLPFGTHAFKAFRYGASFTDVASGSVTVSSGVPRSLVLKFRGAGSVSGVVYDPPATEGAEPQPAFGVDVVLSSRIFINDGQLVCDLRPGPSHRARSDLDGHFDFPGVTVGSFGITAHHEFLDLDIGAKGTVATDGQAVGPLHLYFTNTIAGVLSGTVFLPDGVTPAGAGIEVTVDGALPEVTVQTDADGFYRFAPILAEGNWVLTATDPETGATVQERIHLRKGEDAPYDVRLKGRGTVRVHVVDGADQPVEEASVALQETEYPGNSYESFVSASSDGVATFSGVFEGPLSATVADPNGRGGRASGVLPGPGETVDITVRVTTTGTVEGHFRMPGTGTPIPLGTVTLIANGKAIGQTTTDSLDDPGAFGFSFVPAGSIRLEAIDPLTARTGFAVGTLEHEDDIVLLDVTAQALGIVTGVITLNDVREPRARIDLVSGSFRVSTFADEDGVYRVEGVPEGHVVVTASRSGGGLKGTSSRTLSEEGKVLEIDVSLRDTGRVTGTVAAAGGGAPTISVVTVQVGGTGGGKSTTTTDELGAFVFEQVPAGLATFTVEVAGSIDRGKATAEVPARGAVNVPIVLNGVGAIQGTVEGVPETGDYTSDVLINGTGAFPYSLYAVPGPGPNGTFLLPEVLAGPVTASLRAFGPLRLYGADTGTVLPGETLNLVLQLQPTGSVRGTVLRAGGESAFGADVELTTTVGKLRTQVGPIGVFTLEGVPVGDVTARVSDTFTGGVGMASGTVVEGEELVLDEITLDDTTVAVVSVDPADGTEGVLRDRPVRLVFSDPLASFSSGNVSAKNGSSTVSLTPVASPDKLELTLQPSGGQWPDARELVVTVTTGITDVFGRHPVQSFTSRFRTVDESAPVVAAVEPANLAIQVPGVAVVRVTFDEPLSATFDPSALVGVALRGGGPIAGAVDLTPDRTQAVFTPDTPLLPNALYDVEVNGAVDESGNTQTIAFKSSFTTIDTIPPVLTPSTPSPGSWTNDSTPAIRIDLTDPQPGSGIDLTVGSAALRIGSIDVVPTVTATALTHTPTAPLAEGWYPVSAIVRDRAGNMGVLPSAFDFGVDVTPPLLATITSPTEGEHVAGAVRLQLGATDTPSGVTSVDVFVDGAPATVMPVAPPLEVDWSSATVADGWHILTARGRDRAGNLGPLGPGVGVLVDNHPLTVDVLSPAPGSRFRDTVTVVARTSEPVSRVDFLLEGVVTPGHSIDPLTYDATFDLTGVDGDVAVTVTALGLLGEVASHAIGIVVDHEPPPAPDVARITAEESDAGYSIVQGQPGAVEGVATVRITNPVTSQVVTTLAAADGSFAARILALLGDSLMVVAVDDVGNESVAVPIVVERRSSTDEGVPLEGLKLWVSADEGVTEDVSGNVERWADRSDNANDLVQTVAAKRPAPALGDGGWPVVRFDGADDSVSFPARLTTIRTVFWVVSESPDAAGVSSERSLLGDGTYADFRGGAGDPGPIWGSGASNLVRSGQTWLNGDVVDGTQVTRPREMSVISVVTTGNVYAEKFGEARYSAPWWGDLAELIVYDRPLTAGERQAVEDYLVRKYRPYAPSASTPAISPAGGVFTGSTTVQLSTTTLGAQIRYTLDRSEPTASSELYVGAFVIDETTTVKARAFLPGFLDSATATATFVRDDQTPVVTASPVLWLRADAGIATNGGGWVTEWLDQSGHENHARQTNGLKVPRLVSNETAGLPVVRFDGVDDTVLFPARLTTIRTVFWVVSESPDAAGVSSERSLLGDGTYVDFRGGAGDPGPIWGSGASNLVRSGQTRVNGLPVDGIQRGRPREVSVVSVVTTGNAYAEKFGEARYSASWWGDLAELIVYDRALGASERQAVEGYLLAKYATTGRVTTPSITPPGGVFTGMVSVTVSTATPGAEIHCTIDGTEPTVLSDLCADPITIDRTTTLKAKAFHPDLTESATATAGFTEHADATPLLPGLQLWWRADAGVPGEAGDYWEDQSGQGNHGRQPSGAKAPRLFPNVANGRPVMRFDGVDDTVLFPARLTTIRTVFWVVSESPDAAGVEAERSLLGDGTYTYFRGGNGDPGAIWGSGASVQVKSGGTRVNGADVLDETGVGRPRQLAVISLVTTGSTYAEMFGAARYSVPWWGDLAELIVYDRALEPAEVLEVERFLNRKYQIFMEIP